MREKIWVSGAGQLQEQSWGTLAGKLPDLCEPKLQGTGQALYESGAKPTGYQALCESGAKPTGYQALCETNRAGRASSSPGLGLMLCCWVGIV